MQASKRALIASYKGEIQDLRELLAEGFADRQKLREFERNVAALEGEVAELDAAAAQARAKINEAELRMLQVEREFQTGVAAELGETQAKLSEVTERLLHIIKTLRVGHLMILPQFGSLSHEKTMQNIERISKSVLPHLRGVWDNEGWEDHWWPKTCKPAARAAA